MSKPHIRRAEVFSPFDAFPDKMQWCVISTDDKYKLDPNSREKDPRIFGHGNTVQEAWEDYLKEVKEFDEFLDECGKSK